MKAAHFKKHLPEYTIASRCPNFGDFYGTPAQQIYNFTNVWPKGISLEGDGIEYAENFLRNPQYLLTVDKPNEKRRNKGEEEDDDENYPMYEWLFILSKISIERNMETNNVLLLLLFSRREADILMS
ncbi:Protein of unknown function [Gryllus bimaculatus]|nr:Protein of unknown function [Gryllus bimaculatus]